MVQEYTSYTESPQQQQDFQVIKPNIKKIFLKNLSTVGMIVAAIIGIILILHFTAGLDTFLSVFESFNITVNPSKIILYSILAVAAVSAIILTASYLSLGSIRYELYADKIIVYKSVFVAMVSSDEIPYKNIIRVSSNKEGIFNSIFNSGTVVLDLSGIKFSSIQLKFIDSPEEVSQFIQESVQNHTQTNQAQFTESYKINNILNRNF